MEAKHAYFKQVAKSCNFKNVPYSVARRHQGLLCAYLQSTIFFDTELVCGPGKRIFNRSTLIRTVIIFMTIALLLLSAKEPKDIHNENPSLIAFVTESTQLSTTSSVLVYRYAH